MCVYICIYMYIYMYVHIYECVYVCNQFSHNAMNVIAFVTFYLTCGFGHMR